MGKLMKNILLIDTNLSGHHYYYVKALVNKKNKYILYLPKSELFDNQIYYESNKVNNFIDYINWMKKIKKIILDEKIDIVHFLYADSLYKYFGLFLPKSLKKIKIICTFHQIRRGLLRTLSLKRI